MESKFEQDLIQTIQTSVINQLRKTEFIDTSYKANKINLPQDLLTECYNRMDIEQIKSLIVTRLEQEVADKIVNKLISEYSNDIKQIMSNTELREELRGILRNKIQETKRILEGE